jgi:hypothetical protein
VKSSMKTSIILSTKSEKILIMHLRKVKGALQRPKCIFLYAYVPNGHVNVVFS